MGAEGVQEGTKHMPEYTVSWTIEIDAETPVRAAFAALALQRDPTSWATVFTVHTDDGDVTVDLNPRQPGPPSLSGPWTLTA